MSLNSQDINRAREALQTIPPDIDRDTWVRVGMGAHAAGLTLDDFDAWSAGAGNYNARVVRDVWRSIKPNKGIGPGTLYQMAAEHGWRIGGASRPPRVKPPARPPKPVRSDMSADAVWARCEPATAEHPYVRSKAAQGVPLDGLRVVPEGDPLVIAGQSMAGALVVPLLRPDGSISSLQCVTVGETAERLRAADKTTKLSLPGHSQEGWFTVGDMVPGGDVFVCEGIGTAWACWRATGEPAVVCFGWGRVRVVSQALRQQDAAARLVLCPDVGKEAEAFKIAREVRARVAAMPDGWEQNADVGDFALQEGADALAELLAGAKPPEQRFKLLGSSDLKALPPMVWRIREVLPAEGLAAVYGPSRSGKSFLLLDAACAIAEGRDWFGHRVKAAPVVYVALEGQAGFRVRVRAWEQANGRALPERLRLVLEPFKLVEASDVRDLAAAILELGPGSVTILDTLNRAAPGLDENASADMGCMIQAAAALQRLIGGLVVLVHHTGKDPSKGLRGHSSLIGALDGSLEVARDGERRTWISDKVKEGPDGKVHAFRLETVNLGFDEDGEPISSCVVQADTSAEEIKRVKLPQGGNQRIVYQALGPMFRASLKFGQAGAPSYRPCLELEAAITAAAAHMTCASDRRLERSREAITGLVSRGVMGHRDGWIWLV